MTHRLHFPAMAAILLFPFCISSCASDIEEEMEKTATPRQRSIASSDDEIYFDVSLLHETRGGEHPLHFSMSALLKDSETPEGSYGDLFIDHDLVEDIGTNGDHFWVDRSQSRFWPAGDDVTLDFYIHASGYEHYNHTDSVKDHMGIDWEDDDKKFSPSLKVFMNNEASRQEELLYAAVFNQKRGADGNVMPLDIDLKHALTHVEFETKLTNENIHVEIQDITLCGTAFGAYFRFPTSPDEDASWDIPKHASNTVGIHIDAGTTDADGIYTAHTVEKELKGISYVMADGVRTTVKGKDIKVIPGSYKRGRYTAGLWSGMYLKVNCTIWNVSQRGKFNRNTDFVLWGSRDAETGEPMPAVLYMPIDWDNTATGSDAMGKCYTYTITFGSGNGAKAADGRNLPGMAECSVRPSEEL